MPEQSLEVFLEIAKVALKELINKSLEFYIQNSTTANETCGNEELRMESIKLKDSGAYGRILTFFNSSQTEIKKLIEEGNYQDVLDVVGSMYSEVTLISNSVFPDKHTIEADAVRHWCTAVSGNLRILIRSTSQPK